MPGGVGGGAAGIGAATLIWKMNACPALAASAPTMSMKPGARYLASPVGSVALTWAPADAARPAVRITEMTSNPATRLVVALSDKMPWSCGPYE